MTTILPALTTAGFPIHLPLSISIIFELYYYKNMNNDYAKEVFVTNNREETTAGVMGLTELTQLKY